MTDVEGAGRPYLAEGLNLVGVGAIPGFPEGQGLQAVLDDLAATPQCLGMHLHDPATTITSMSPLHIHAEDYRSFLALVPSQVG